MAASTPAAVRKQISQRKPDPVYLIVGDDETEMSRLAGELSGLVEDELRAFNTERLYAGEKGGTAAAVVEAARMLPMMADRRVVTVFRAEKMLKPKRRGKSGGDAEDEADPADLETLDAYIKDPVPQTTLVFVAADVDRGRKVYKTLAKHGTVVECWGLKPGREARVDLREVARTAESLVRQAVSEAGQQIEPAAARLIAERAGTDISRLRGDMDRLLLYTAGATRYSAESRTSSTAIGVRSHPGHTAGRTRSASRNASASRARSASGIRST